MDEEEEETRLLTDLQHQADATGQLDRVICELREELKHTRNRRLDSAAIVNRLHSEREKDQSEFAFAELENRREQRTIPDKIV